MQDFPGVQQLRIHPPLQGTWDQSLLWEDSTCQEVTKPVCHNYRACVQQLPKLVHPIERAHPSVQFSRSVMSDSLRPHRLRHTRLPSPSSTPGAYSNSWPSSQWCHPALSSFVVPFSSCLQSFPASGSFPMSQSVLHIRWPKYWSFSFSISPSNEYSGLISFRIDWFNLLVVQETLKSLLQHHSSKASILQCSPL